MSLKIKWKWKKKKINKFENGMWQHKANESDSSKSEVRVEN